MKINAISKKEFLNLVINQTGELFEKINTPEVFIVKRFYEPEKINGLRKTAFHWGIKTEPSWHPCLDGCPDYHRIHDNYPQAHVKARMHAYYYHGYYPQNNKLFDFFSEIFDIKNFLAGYPAGTFIKHIPSQGQIGRINFHNYPRGGGHQTEHIDPVSNFAALQTIVQASEIGKDYLTGGLFARKEKGGEKFYIDQYAIVGDLMVLSPGIPHGVDAIDPSEGLNWKTNDGRWMVMPIIINSDYESPQNVKPKEI